MVHMVRAVTLAIVAVSISCLTTQIDAVPTSMQDMDDELAGKVDPTVASRAVPTNDKIYKLRQQLHWCGSPEGEVGLDDSHCQKQFPASFSRDFSCPLIHKRDPSFHTPPSSAKEALQLLESEALNPYLPGNCSAVVAVIKRHADDGNRHGQDYSVRYLGGGPDPSQPHEPWSSSKVLAAAHAAARMRSLSNGSIGLPAQEEAESRSSPSLPLSLQLGDMLTVITSYDESLGLTSNSLGAYFQSIGGHELANQYIHSVLGAAYDNETFGGNYGEAVPATLSYTFKEQGANKSLTEKPDPTPSPPIPNTMSSVTMAEWVRRLVMFREDAFHGQQLPHLKWEDVQEILYGAASNSQFAPWFQWGGMSMSSDIYLQQGFNLKDSRGKQHPTQTDSVDDWVVFSKLGAGFSSIRDRFEITLNGYACTPEYEFVLTGLVHSGVSLTAADELMQSTVSAVAKGLSEIIQ